MRQPDILRTSPSDYDGLAYRETRRRRLNTDDAATPSAYARIWPEPSNTARNALVDFPTGGWGPFWAPDYDEAAYYQGQEDEGDEGESEEDEEEDVESAATSSPPPMSDSQSSKGSSAGSKNPEEAAKELYCGYRGRKELVTHWEACVQESRDGNTAATEWRESQTFTSPFNKAMVELLRLLFVDQGTVPTSAIHQKLLSFMLSRYQLNISKIEKLMDSNMDVNYSRTGVQRLKTICQELVGICDLTSARFLLDQTLCLLTKLGVAMIRQGVMTAGQCAAHLYADHSAMIDFNDETRRRNFKLLFQYTRWCKCPHLDLDLCQMLSGWKQPNLCFLQRYAESPSRSLEVQREYYLLRPDRLLIKLLLLFLHESSMGVDANLKPASQTLSPPTIAAISELVDMAGSCSAMYMMIKWTFVLLIRLSAMRNEHKSKSALTSLLESVCMNVALRPEPINSIFHSESCLGTRQETFLTKPRLVSHAINLLLDSLCHTSASLNQVVVSCLLHFCVLSKRRGLLDYKAVESLSGNTFLISFFERFVVPAPVIQNTAVPKRSRSFLITSSGMGSPPKSSPYTAPVSASMTPMTMRQFLLHKLPLTSLIQSDSGDRTLHKFSNQLSLVQLICGLSSHEFIIGVVHSLLDQHLMTYSASTLQSEVKQDNILLTQLLIFAVGCAPLVGLTALRAFPSYTCLMACQEIIDDAGKSETSEDANYATKNVAGPPRRSSLTGLPGHDKMFTIERFLETVRQHRHLLVDRDSGFQQCLPNEVSVLKSLVPQTWLTHLDYLGACMDEGSLGISCHPLTLVREFLTVLQELYNKTQISSGMTNGETKRIARSHLAQLHASFKGISLEQSRVTDTNDEQQDAASVFAVAVCNKTWRYLLVGLLDYLSWRHLSAQNTEASNIQCDHILMSFLTMEFRTDRFLAGGSDSLPARVLDTFKRIKAATDRGTSLLVDQNLSKNTILEVFLAWISELSPKAGWISFVRSALLRRLWTEAQDVEGALLRLKGFEITNFLDFMQKRLAPIPVAAAHHVASTNDVRCCLEFICYNEKAVGPNVASTIFLHLLCDPVVAIVQ